VDVPFEIAAAGVVELARSCAARGSVPATSGNFSVVVSRDPLRLAITPSGMDKGAVGLGDVLEIGEREEVVRGSGRPSAESALHLGLARAGEVGAVAHTHGLWATLVSQRHAAEGSLTLTGFEMLKALRGVTTHEHREALPVVPNVQDWRAAWPAVRGALERHPGAHGLLIDGHGLYTWGRDVAEARRHVEALEYLLEAYGRSTWR
jgi:methylthioribulose-1-phosphate dehydratase